MRQRVSRNVVPPGGWSYPQEITGGPRAITGSGFDDLVDKLTQFRISNHILIGSPPDDIERYLCEKYPANCFPVAGDAPPVQTQPKTLRERVTQWAANRYARSGKIELVEQDEADRRAAICAGCPENKEWKTSCQPCIADTSRTLLMIRQNRKPSIEVLACNLMGHENTCATMMPPELLAHSKKYLADSPEFCWLRDLKPE